MSMRRLRRFGVGLAAGILGMAAAPALASADITIPAGSTATLSNVSMGACNSLTYGYQLNGGPEVTEATFWGGCGRSWYGNVKIGPFSTAQQLRIDLRDNNCGYNFDSNGPHAYVYGSGSSYSVGIADGGGYCEHPPWMYDPGSNLSLSVAISQPADTTPPSVSVSHTVDGQAGWNVHSPVTETVKASDSGSGLAAGSPSCTVDGQSASLTSSGSGEWTFPVAGDGNHAVKCSASDRAGNRSSASDSTSIDTTPPQISGSRSPEANAFGWSNGPVKVSFACSDAAGGSGLASCGPDQTLSGEGAGQSVTGTAADNAGNSSQASVGNINIDLTPPTVAYSDHPASYTVDQSVNITCAASDALSGIDPANTKCEDISGDAYTFSIGENDFSANATDKAGNTASGHTSFTVRVTTDSLSALTQRWVSKGGVANALCAKLSAAADSMARGDTNSKNGQLDAYRNQLAAQSGKSIDADKAAILIALSKDL